MFSYSHFVHPVVSDLRILEPLTSAYGSVRIVAADLSKFPCGTIVTVDHPSLGTFNAVVLDTGGSMKRAWQNGLVWMDLAFTTESDPGIYSTTSSNTTYTVQRWGW